MQVPWVQPVTKHWEEVSDISRVAHCACRWEAVEIHYGHVLQTLEVDRSRILHTALVSIGLWWQAFLNCSCGTLKKNWRWLIPAFSNHFMTQEVFSAYSCAWSSSKNVIAAQRRLQGEHDHRFGHDVMHPEHGSYNHSTAKVTCETLKKNWLWAIPSRTSKEVMSADPLLRSSASQRHRCSHSHRLSQLSETLWKWFWDAFSRRSWATAIVLGTWAGTVDSSAAEQHTQQSLQSQSLLCITPRRSATSHWKDARPYSIYHPSPGCRIRWFDGLPGGVSRDRLSSAFSKQSKSLCRRSTQESWHTWTEVFWHAVDLCNCVISSVMPATRK